jgi:hypothetical protein
VKKVVTAAFSILLISATAASAANTFWKEGVTQGQMVEDQMDCSVVGNQSAPADRTNGVDRNFQLRMKLIGRCMKNLGYQEVKVRGCGPFKRMPDMSQPVTITSDTCVKGVEYGYVFVN